MTRDTGWPYAQLQGCASLLVEVAYEADGGIIEDKATTTYGLVRGIRCSGQAVLHGRTRIYFDALAVRRGASFPGPRLRRQKL